jgi:hypothetical protein
MSERALAFLEDWVNEHIHLDGLNGITRGRNSWRTNV